MAGITPIKINSDDWQHLRSNVLPEYQGQEPGKINIAVSRPVDRAMLGVSRLGSKEFESFKQIVEGQKIGDGQDDLREARLLLLFLKASGSYRNNPEAYRQLETDLIVSIREQERSLNSSPRPKIKIQDPFFGILQLSQKVRLGPALVSTSQLPTAAQAAERGGMTVASPVVVTESVEKKVFPPFTGKQGENAEVLLDRLMSPVHFKAALNWHNKDIALDDVRQMVNDAFKEYHLLIEVMNGTKRKPVFSDHPSVRPAFVRSLRIGSQNFTILFGYPFAVKAETAFRRQDADSKSSANPSPLILSSNDNGASSPLALQDGDVLPLPAMVLREKSEADLLEELHTAAKRWKNNPEDPDLARVLRNALVDYVRKIHLGTAPNMVDGALYSANPNYLNYFRLSDGTTILSLEDLPRINVVADSKVRGMIHADHSKGKSEVRGK